MYSFPFNIWHSVFPIQLLLAAGQGLSDLAELDVPCLFTAPRSVQEALLCPVNSDSTFRRLLRFLGGRDLFSVMLGEQQVTIVTSCSKVEGESYSERLWKLHPWRYPKLNCMGP